MSQPTQTPLSQALREMLDQYFNNLEGTQPQHIHQMVISSVEKPLFEYILQRCKGNQSAAADLLGINRNTLRKRLQLYGLL